MALSLSSKNRLFIFLGLFASIFFVSPSAFADDVFDEEVEKVEVISDTIAGIISAMTSVAILPMGISSAMKCFRHIVLNNV